MTVDPRDDTNPFAPPTADIGHRSIPVAPGDDAEAELIRRHHLSHESSIKSVGLLNYLAGGLGLFVAAVLVLMSAGLVVNPQAAEPGPFQLQGIFIVFAAVFYGVVGAVNLALGFGLRRLQVWARWTAMVLSALALAYTVLTMVVILAFMAKSNLAGPAVMLTMAVAILAYVFYLMVSPKAGVVFSPEYRRVIARTPGIKSRSSLIVKLLVGLLVLLLGVAVAGMVLQLLLTR